MSNKKNFNCLIWLYLAPKLQFYPLTLFIHFIYLSRYKSEIHILKRVKYEIGLGKPNRAIGEPDRPMSTSPKKVEPIPCVGPWQDKGPDSPTMFRETCPTRMSDLSYKDEWFVLQGWEACPASMRGLLSKPERLALQGEKAGPHHYKRPQHPRKKVCVTDSSLAL